MWLIFTVDWVYVCGRKSILCKVTETDTGNSKNKGQNNIMRVHKQNE